MSCGDELRIYGEPETITPACGLVDTIAVFVGWHSFSIIHQHYTDDFGSYGIAGIVSCMYAASAL